MSLILGNNDSPSTVPTDMHQRIQFLWNLSMLPGQFKMSLQNEIKNYYWFIFSQKEHLKSELWFFAAKKKRLMSKGALRATYFKISKNSLVVEFTEQNIYQVVDFGWWLETLTQSQEYRMKSLTSRLGIQVGWTNPWVSSKMNCWNKTNPTKSKFLSR